VTALVRAELIKLRTVTGNVVLLIIAVAVPLGFSVLIPIIVPKSEIGDLTPNSMFGLALAGLNIAWILVGVIGVQTITQEFRFTARLTFSAEPRRPRVLVAKVLTVTMGGLAIGAVVVTFGLVVGGALLRARDLPFDTSWPGFWRAAVGSIIVTALYGLVGLGLGAILRSPAAAITIYLIWVLVVDGILYAVLPKIGQFSPFTAGSQLSALEPPDPGLGPLWGGLLFAGFAVALVVVGTLQVTRRDA
jgi:ABC-2 type transport system permease protein